MFKLKGLSKKERNWVLYDIANSAYILTVITVLFPIYYDSVTIDNPSSTQVFSFVTAGIALIVALISPFIGALSNYRGNKKKFFTLFLSIGVIGSLGLVIPGLQMITLLAFFAISGIGYSVTNVIYDAFLLDVTSEERMDEVSSQGYAWGYIGSMIPFAIAIIPYALYTFEFIPSSYEYLTVAFAFLVAIIWWAIYSIPMLKDVEQTYNIEKVKYPFKEAVKSLKETFSHVYKYKTIFIFMLAYLFYNDVVNTVIRMATIIGGDLGVSVAVLLGVVVLVQVIAFPSAIIYGRMAKKFGDKPMIYYGIVVYAITIVITSFIYENTTWLMWVVGVLVGSAQGGIQSISRSYFAKMLPKDKANEFFGFFSVFGRFSGIFSPFLLGVFIIVFGSVNYAILTLIFPLIISGILLLFVSREKQKELLNQEIESKI